MNKINKDNFKQDSYKYGFVTEIEDEKIPKGLNEDVIKLISNKKNEPEWMLEWRLAAYERLKSMEVPKWARANIADIDFQDLYYYWLGSCNRMNMIECPRADNQSIYLNQVHLTLQLFLENYHRLMELRFDQRIEQFPF